VLQLARKKYEANRKEPVVWQRKKEKKSHYYSEERKRATLKENM